MTNTQGSSDANLSRVILHSDADDSAGFTKVRIAPTREALATVSIIYERVEGIGPDLQAPLHAESLK